MIILARSDFSLLSIFPTERKHDAGILADSGLLRYLTQYAFSTTDHAYNRSCRSCIPSKGSPTETLPYSGAKSPHGRIINRAMSSVRISVRWIFGDISNYFKFADFFLKKIWR